MLSALALKYKARSRVRIGLLVVAALALAPVAMLPAHAATSAGDGPVSVDAPYTKANARPITPGDAIAPCGTNRRQQNEPTSAVDPTQPQHRDVGLQRLLHGRGRRRHLDRLLPQHRRRPHLDRLPAAGLPDRQLARGPGQPAAASGHHATPATRCRPGTSTAACSTWATRSTAWPRRTARSGSRPTTSTPRTTCAPASSPRATPALNGKFNDKTAIEVDRGVNSPYAGQRVRRVSACSRATATTRSSSSAPPTTARRSATPTRISEGSQDNQFADIAVTSNGTVYVVWNGFVGSRATRPRRDALREVHRRRQAASPSRAVAADFDGFDAADTAGDPEAAAEAHEQAFEHADGPGVRARSRARPATRATAAPAPSPA